MTFFSCIVCVGLFLGVTGTRSIMSRVESAPSITLFFLMNVRESWTEYVEKRDIPTEDSVLPI